MEAAGLLPLTNGNRRLGTRRFDRNGGAMEGALR